MEIIGMGIVFMMGICLAPVVVLAVGIVIARIVGIVKDIFGGKK